MIGIDGVRPDALRAAETPALDALVANGYASFDAMNDDITISGGMVRNSLWRAVGQAQCGGQQF